MARPSSSTSSREAALERRKALTNGGKKAAGRFTSGPARVRSAADARPTRTNAAPQEASPVSSPVVVQDSAPARARAPQLSVAPTPTAQRQRQPISNPSRDLVLARREALAKRGKRADTSRDRTRTEVPRQPAKPDTGSDRPCQCKGRQDPPVIQPTGTPSLSNGLSARNSGKPSGLSQASSRSPRRASQHNPSRALVLARREALSKRGKSASAPTSTTAATVARQTNPDLSSRELSQKVRELKSKVGSAGSSRNGGSRPTGPNRHGSRQNAAADAHWKVGVSETSGGQTVTGTQANRSVKTTGNEASTCRPITGTEYLGAEVFQTFCQSEPLTRPAAKVRETATTHGNRVTGNEVGRSTKVTGDEPGTCKNVTGTEYVSANQSSTYCGTSTPSPRKVGHTLTQAGRPISGVMVGRSEKVTGDEPGSGRQLTGDQYVTEAAQTGGRAPAKVASLQTLRGTGITGTHVGRSDKVTGDEPGSCRNITGDEYIGSQQYQAFCGAKPAPEAAKVGFSVTNRSLVVSGTRTGRSERVTGDEPGTCKAVTGTPYAGLEEAGNWCSSQQVDQIRHRTPVRMGTVMSGIQPGIGGVMTGADKGACEAVTGTPYVGPDQLNQACGSAAIGDADFPQPLEGDQPWQRFSVQSPARTAHTARERNPGVTGTGYSQGSRITGPFDMAGGKVTGTEQFRSDRRVNAVARGPLVAAAAAASEAVSPDATEERPRSRVTGEGNSAGLKITGDDWDRGDRVTGTEGVSARRRNPSRPGPMTAMAGFQSKRNESIPEPVSRVTGSSGNTSAGSLITVSGGARG